MIIDDGKLDNKKMQNTPDILLEKSSNSGNSAKNNRDHQNNGNGDHHDNEEGK